MVFLLGLDIDEQRFSLTAIIVVIVRRVTVAINHLSEHSNLAIGIHGTLIPVCKLAHVSVG